ncbi:hydrogenase nickel incorporation protein HypB [Iamia sp.]|uniref:hydrogenase nickel incorporation protein HypB n=1 Tax=Iamia sp. TaxID=2722710 RepID=UPI002D1D250F|nr:hydrogenase nickel incorporation protein HypB [Iamia sp.]HXH56630.1 hydrogenase nickel incorporation protein HypB [Iamia sp.]
MCSTCGCAGDGDPVITDPAHVHSHDHDHDHEPGHSHGHGHSHDGEGAAPHVQAPVTTETLTLEQKVLAENDLGAARNRGWFDGRGILALNLMSSPGAGKTTLLVRTITDLAGRRELSVVEGDQETLFDAERIRATGTKVVQINTGSGCHLDADMLARGLRVLDPAVGSVVLIENVGNLVCPALFDLGESARVVIMSVTEGGDKPLKYPHMFRSADLLILNKVDLLPYVDFDVGRCTADARRLKPDLEVLAVSATTGDGLDQWYAWLDRTLAPAVL